MSPFVSIGPFAFALDRLVAVALIWAFLGVTKRIGVSIDGRAERGGWVAVGVGLVAARGGFVLSNAEAYAVEPWTVLAVWEGGFLVWPGIAGAATTTVVLLGAGRGAGWMLAALGAAGAAHAVVAATLLAPPQTPLPRGIALATVAGEPAPLDDFRGAPMVINLWASWCPPCVRELPMIADVAAASATPVLLVNQRETAVVVRAFLGGQGVPDKTVRLDPLGALADALGTSALPTTLFIDADGSIRDIHAGEISRAALTAGIRRLERSHP